jgi:hypothetical protein
VLVEEKNGARMSEVVWPRSIKCKDKLKSVKITEEDEEMIKKKLTCGPASLH